MNAPAGNNIVTSTPSKTSPSPAKSTPKDQKVFTTSKPIDPLWLAQTKMETANLVNANKLLVKIFQFKYTLCLQYTFFNTHQL